MQIWAILRQRLAALRKRKQLNRDLDDELAFHVALREEKLRESGMGAAEAAAAARRGFGNPVLLKEQSRSEWMFQWLENIRYDLRFGLRMLRKERRFSALAVLALALGIGATTVIFSVIDNVLLEPFPYRDSERLTKFYIHDPAHPEQTGRSDFLMPEYHTFKEQNHVFEDVIATNGLDVVYTSSDDTKLFPGYETTANTFDFFGVAPLLGRPMVPDDGRADAPPVAVMSYRAWQRDFGGDANIIGRQLTLNGQSTTVIAVMPSRFQLYDGDFWLPIQVEPPDVRVATMGRLKAGVSVREAAADLDVIAKNLAKVFPANYPKRFDVTAVSLVDRVVRRFRPLLYALMAAVLMLLLISCSNVANLLLTRATIREREIAVRASLGASRTRLVAQLTVEGFLLAVLGCIAGCGLAYAAIRGVAAALPRDLIPNESVIALNPRVLLFALALAFLTTLLSGLAPAFLAIGRDLNQRMKSVSKGIGSGDHGRLRSALVISQVALSIVLLVGAGLMLRSVLALQNVDLGFTPDHVLTTRISFPRGRYDSAEQKHVFFRAAMQRIRALPGVVAVAEASALPPLGGPRSEVTVPGITSGEKQRSSVQLVSADYFKTLGVQLLRGRLFEEADIESARHVALVNQTLANKFFGKDDPIGRSIKFNAFDILPESPRDTYFEIVGVVADAKNNGLDQPAQPESFLPYTVSGVMGRGVVVRTSVDPHSMFASVRRELRTADSSLVPTTMQTLDDVLKQNFYSQPRFALLVLGLFALIGLLLVAIGTFSVMAYTVSLQTHDIAVRMALGAQRGTVLRMVLSRGLRMIAWGIAIGEFAGFAATRLLRNQLWGVSPHDPLTLGAVVVLLLVVGVAACIVPARRATRVHPMAVLRYE